MLYVVVVVAAADGRYYVPIPRTVYPSKTGNGPREYGEPEYHFSRRQLDFARVLNSFQFGYDFDELLERMDFVVDD